jgi:hypothetical protein
MKGGNNVKTEFTIGGSVTMEIISENKTVLISLLTNDRNEITFPLSADETDLLIAALSYHKKQVEGK